MIKVYMARTLDPKTLLARRIIRKYTGDRTRKAVRHRPLPARPKGVPKTTDVVGVFAEPSDKYIDGLYVTPVAGKGLGLFCARDIDRGEAIGVYDGTTYTKEEFDTLPNVEILNHYAIDYAIDFPRGRSEDMVVAPDVAVKPGGLWVDPLRYPLAIANEPHRGRANAHMHPKRGVVTLYALRRIPAGTEITWFYGENYQYIRDELGYTVPPQTPPVRQKK